MRLSITHKKGRERERRSRKGMGGERKGGEKENVRSVNKGGQGMRSNNTCVGYPCALLGHSLANQHYIYIPTLRAVYHFSGARVMFA